MYPMIIFKHYYFLSLMFIKCLKIDFEFPVFRDIKSFSGPLSFTLQLLESEEDPLALPISQTNTLVRIMWKLNKRFWKGSDWGWNLLFWQFVTNWFNTKWNKVVETVLNRLHRYTYVHRLRSRPLHVPNRNRVWIP